jgi:hypothetical protein
MKLPEYRPTATQWDSDHDTKDAGASLALIVPVVLIVVGVAMFLFGVFR